MNDPTHQRPIFYDPGQKRWPLVRNGVLSMGALLSVLLGLLIVSVVFQPVLPVLGLHPTEPARGPRPVPRREPSAVTGSARTAFDETKQQRHDEMGRVPPAAASLARGTVPSAQPLTFGYYVNWDPGSLSSLEANLDALDVLVPEWLHVAGPDGAVTEDEPARQKQVRDYLQAHHAGLRVMPLVNNYDDSSQRWDGQNLARVLEYPAGRDRIVRQLLDYLRKSASAGLTIDFQELPPESGASFHAFLAELAAPLRAAGMRLAVTAPAESPTCDYRELSRLADFVVLAVYDQHWPGSSAGSLAGVDWVSDVLHLRLQDVPPEKTVIGLGSYAYDWREGDEAVSRTFDEAMLTARDRRAESFMDGASLNPTFLYRDGERREHRVWFLDAATAFNQVAAARPLHPRGFALWRLGTEDVSVWRVLAHGAALDAKGAAGLADINFRYRLDHVGDGEVFQVTERPRRGRREIRFDAGRGLIAAERFAQLPSPYVVKHYGTRERKIALTFDDGPDPTFTPAVLEVLRARRAPATFFVIGANAEAHPELLRREIAEGHEIGNHTFTHPYLSKISDAQLRLEIAATGRMIESAVQRQTILFRPPYAEFDDPTTPEAVEHLGTVNEMGYLVVGDKLDTDDWKRPGTEAIVRAVLEAADHGEGRVVLMHDGGGDRSQTVQALPVIIDSLRARGFELVTVSGLLGRARDAVMPPLSGRKRMVAWFNRGVFSLVNVGTDALASLFLLGIALGVARLFFVGTLALVDGRRRSAAGAAAAPRVQTILPSVAVIIPAYNEERVIVHSIASLLDSRYSGPLEVVVVDDGSQDRTSSRVREAFRLDPRVKVFAKQNGGKAAALNYGIRQTSAEVLVALDADTVFQPDTIAKLVRHFGDPRVGAVAGNAKVGNRVNVLTKWQALEYVTSQNLERRAFHVLNSIAVVPGAVGAWRRELVERLGGFTHVTMAEDADLTISILRLGYRILYDDEAVALTEAPDTIRGFLDQRFRWMYGTTQAVWKHRDCLFNPRHGALGLVALPNIVIFQVFFALISPVMDLMLVLSLAGTLLTGWQHPGQASAQTLLHTLIYYALFTAADFAAAWIAFALEPKEDRRLLPWLFPQRFLYRQLLYYVAIRSTVAALRGARVKWGKVPRKATVRLETTLRTGNRA
jgi:cellulose synthase/poly-beta-1,6-N-acetylglucosamine synthase-like glycosyltransferase/peptidoglycan/xylan/chitin deacetylase (PgdA/CDA1 family)/spore germination protein YaaH